MEQAITHIDLWIKAFAEGFVAFPIVYYVIKNFGSVIVTDLQALWAKYVTKTPVVAAPVVATPVVTSVTNG